jgi:hypothetical protein
MLLRSSVRFVRTPDFPNHISFEGLEIGMRPETRKKK